MTRPLPMGSILTIFGGKVQLVDREPGTTKFKAKFWLEALEDTSIHRVRLRAGAVFRVSSTLVYRSPKLAPAPRARASRFVGVTWNKERRRWVASGYEVGKRICLGSYVDEADAGAAALRYRQRKAHEAAARYDDAHFRQAI